MKDSKAESLKKRTLSDAICSIVFAILIAAMAIVEFVVYQTSEGAGVSHLTNGVYAVVACIALVIAGLILIEVRRIGRPFSKNIIWKLRILAFVIIIGAYAPDLVTFAVTLFHTDSAEFVFIKANNLVIALLGVIIGILSEIFVYGYELQDDMDSIA